MILTSNVKNERKNVPISFWKRNQNVLVSFPYFSCWELIVSFWSRICSPEQIKMCSFDGADSRINSDVLVSFLLAVGTFVERLLLYCFDIISLDWPEAGVEGRARSMSRQPARGPGSPAHGSRAPDPSRTGLASCTAARSPASRPAGTYKEPESCRLSDLP